MQARQSLHSQPLIDVLNVEKCVSRRALRVDVLPLIPRDCAAQSGARREIIKLGNHPFPAFHKPLLLTKAQSKELHPDCTVQNRRSSGSYSLPLATWRHNAPNERHCACDWRQRYTMCLVAIFLQPTRSALMRGLETSNRAVVGHFLQSRSCAILTSLSTALSSNLMRHENSHAEHVSFKKTGI